MTPSLHGSDAGSDEDFGGDGGLDDAGTGSDFELRQADSDSEIDTPLAIRRSKRQCTMNAGSAVAGPSSSAAIDLTDDYSDIGSEIFIPSSPGLSPEPSSGTATTLDALMSAPVNDVPVAPSTATATPTASPTCPPFLGSFKMDESVNPWKVNREFDF
ncbi:hypothetical protein SCLCIDRAFT_31134 [Scleroderma citrinum Foug A]|uniref:Uncharacterized protein n=1 Tax=Scleroderma citrinum Foug A TaxID=1036808 RepID=A0A0C3DEC4_9AGAM|nr:hypothetical protein SCLCIDRAFT_31134 [Scleroderma citrinum Foug A]